MPARPNVQTLIIAAERDEIVPRWSTEHLHRHFAPGVATMKLIPGAGHNVHLDQPEAWVDALRDFVDGVER